VVADELSIRHVGQVKKMNTITNKRVERQNMKNATLICAESGDYTAHELTPDNAVCLQEAYEKSSPEVKLI